MAFIHRVFSLSALFVLSAQCFPPPPPPPPFHPPTFSDCSVKLTDIDYHSSKSPLILKPQYEGGSNVVEVFYPMYSNNKCFASNSYGGIYNPTILLKLTCPGNSLLLPNASDIEVESTFLIRQDRPYPEQFVLTTPESMSTLSPDTLNATPISCSSVIEPIMKEKEDDKYEIGIQINPLDFIPEISLSNKDDLTVARAKILSIIQRRPKIAEDTEFKKGPYYQKSSVDFNKVYDKAYQSEELRKTSPDTIEKYIGDNYLVKGQLISKDDLFYIPEQKSTFFYENTVPVWRSINDGNWKKVGNVIRSMAHESITDFDIFAGAFDSFGVSKNGVKHPVNLTDGQETVSIPEILFKVALDRRHDRRSLVFLTINDPRPQVNSNGKIKNENISCCKKSACQQLYPEFLDYRKGYTCCCNLKDFKQWDSIKNTLGSDIHTEITEPFLGPLGPPPHWPYPAVAN